jgi:hypothetical protein
MEAGMIVIGKASLSVRDTLREEVVEGFTEQTVSFSRSMSLCILRTSAHTARRVQ